jgi:hypothetical protein
MSFLEYIVMFNKVKRDNDILFMVSENNFTEYKVGDIVFVDDFNGMNIDFNVFVIIDSNNIGVPIEYLYYISNDCKNIDFVYQLDDKKIIKKIGKVNISFISDYKKNFILLNKNVRMD